MDSGASSSARLGAELRALRTQRELTLQQLAEQIGFSTAHVSAVELAKSPASEQFVLACDGALNTGGALLALLPAAIYERASRRHRDEARRRWGGELPMPPRGAPAPVAETEWTHGAVQLNLSPDAPLAALLQARFPGMRLSRPTPDFGIDWNLMLPDNSLAAVQVHPATTDPDRDGVLIRVRDAARLEEFLRVPQRALLFGVDTHAEPRIYALDARAARRQLSARSYAGAVLSIPSAYELDDLTYGVLWATSNLDDCLLSDDLALVQNHRKLDTYQRLRSSEVTREIAGDLTHFSHAWLGSVFCARHILRNFGRLGELPLFWTREQRGQEACTWLLFSHKLAYLRATSRYFGSTPMVRVFCVPERAVRDSPPFERILLFLAVALMEAHGVHVHVCTEQEYSDVDGFVLAPGRAIVATWVRADSMWHVDTTAQRPVLAGFAEASGHAAAHSAIATASSSGRLAAFADYLELDLRWLSRRCTTLAHRGCGDLIRPRSRLLTITGLESACARVGGSTAAAP